MTPSESAHADFADLLRLTRLLLLTLARLPAALADDPKDKEARAAVGFNRGLLLAGSTARVGRLRA